MNYSVIIPTLNAGSKLAPLLKALKDQSVPPGEIIVVDSQSEDGTADLARGVDGVEVIDIKRETFDHGKTRDMALRRSNGEFVVFMTQDALPVEARCMERLLQPFEDSRVAAVGGRQQAWPDARPFERLVRANNYPEESRIWRLEDIARLGVRVFLISDVCAAYRRSAYLSVGGFDYPILTNEDMLMAEKLLHAGYKLAYSGDAVVYHSHHLTLRQEYRRNVAIGQTMKAYEERFEHVKETGEGVALFKRVMASLMREKAFAECACFTLNCAARLIGNRVGRKRGERLLQGKNR